MRKQCLRTLRMVKTAMTDTSAWHADNKTATMATRSSFSIAELRGFVDKLGEGREDIVSKLDLGYRFHSFGRTAYRKANNTLLGQGSVEDSTRAEFVCKTFGAPENTTERYVFAE